MLAAFNGFSQESRRVKIGLALGGGGARGIAHLGIIKALEENGIPIDYIAGTSMGSIVGELYASGYSSADQIRIVKEIDWIKIFSEQPEKTVEMTGSRYGIMEPLFRLRFKPWKVYLPLGLNNGQRISNTLFKYTSMANFNAHSDFDRLCIPYRAVAVDVKTGEAVALGRGELSQAIRASMAIPLVFDPALVGGRYYMDGGVVNNLPVDVVKKMGADIVIACDVDILSPLKDEPENIADIARHTFDIATFALKKDNVELADIYIHPDLKDHSMFDYSKFDDLIEYGYRAAMEHMDEIKKAVFSSRNPAPPYYKLETGSLNRAEIKRINVTGLSRVRIPVVIGEFLLRQGERYDSEKAMEGIRRIYATGLFENVWLELENAEENKVVINIHVIEKYPRTISFGVNYRDDEGPGGFIQIIHFNLLGWGERFMPFIRYSKFRKYAGLEIVNDKFLGSTVTLNNGIYYKIDSPYLYSSGEETGQLNIENISLKLSIGVHPHRKLLIMAGVKGEYVTFSENADPDKNLNLFSSILLDTTDSHYFPKSGLKAYVLAQAVEDITFSGLPYYKLQGNGDLYLPAGKRNTFKFHIRGGTSINDLPPYDVFMTGGPEDLPGYYRDEIQSSSTISAELSYRFELLEKIFLQTGISGALLNGNISGGFSAGIHADTPVGPLSIVYGKNIDNRERLYVSLGYSF